jgi:hypothetical protein
MDISGFYSAYTSMAFLCFFYYPEILNIILGPETDAMYQFLGPETDIMGERYFMPSSSILHPQTLTLNASVL